MEDSRKVVSGNVASPSSREDVPTLVSVIIPTWNRIDDLTQCLRSLDKCGRDDIEIIVVDDASTDGTADTVKKLFPHVIIINGRYQCGPAFRRNQAIRASHGEYLWFLDSDVEIPDAGLLDRMLKRFEDDPRVGELGGEISVLGGELDKVYGLRLGRRFTPVRVSVNKGEGVIECDYLASLNSMVRRQVALQVGGFDPYHEWGPEDVDFGVSIHEAGYRNYVGFDYAVFHKASIKGRRSDMTRRYCFGGVRFMIKHAGIHVYLLNFAWIVLRLGIMYLGFPFHFLFEAARGRRLDPFRYTGGIHLLSAYAWHLFHLQEVCRARGRDFLSNEEMERFESWMAHRSEKRKETRL